MKWFVFSATAFRENIIKKKGVEHESTSTLACLAWCGTKVTLIGRNGDEEITATQVATYRGTINYEVVCLLSDRIPREYH